MLRERRWNADMRQRRYVLVGLMVMALVGGGYGLRVWQDQGASAVLGECLAHTFQLQNRLFCEVTRFAPGK